MRLMAISDLHLTSDINREALLKIPDYGPDWLILAGDISDRVEYQEFALRELNKRFDKLIWVPGNHDLWSVAGQKRDIGRGLSRYDALVEIARSFGALTPEDSYLEWPIQDSYNGDRYMIAPLFLLYDYSFRPENVLRQKIREWARVENAVCSDELLLHPDPFPTREAWCAVRCSQTERRLSLIPKIFKTILINHWPLRRDLVCIPRIPRFIPWCGTVLSHDWHIRFNARVVVSGHLHTRRTDIINNCRFEEVSLGYPRQWCYTKGITHYIRQILPDIDCTDNHSQSLPNRF